MLCCIISAFSSSTFSSRWNSSTSPHHSHPRYLVVSVFQSGTLLNLDLSLLTLPFVLSVIPKK